MTEQEVFKQIIKPFYTRKGCFVYQIDHARVPDVYISNKEYTFSGYVENVFWIELKVLQKEYYPLKPKWRPGQLAFIDTQNTFSGVNNVNLALYIEDLCECRLYDDIKQSYDRNDSYKILKV